MRNPIADDQGQPGRCRDERIRVGHDRLVETTDAGTLVECIDGMHKGKWIFWAPSGKCERIGSETWARTGRLA